MKGKRSSSTSPAVIPLAILEPDDGDQPLRRCIGNELVVASPTEPAAFSPDFKLPDDWTVRKRPRRCYFGGRVDKYYYEPGTGREFRSLRSVQKHLIEMEEGLLTPVTQKQKPGKQGDMSRLGAPCPSREMQIVSHNSHFRLPDNWIVEEKTRSSRKYAGQIDRCYIEPETGQRFRSLIAVERYLTAVEENSTAPKALTNNQFTHSTSSEFSKEDSSDDDCSLQVLRNLIKAKKKSTTPKPANHSTASQKQNTSVEENNASVLDSTSPPAKIKWVMTGTGGKLFSPFIGDSIIPQSVKQKWSEAFTLAVRD